MDVQLGPHLEGAEGNYNQGVFHITEYHSQKDLIAKVVEKSNPSFQEVQALKAVRQYVASGQVKTADGHDVSAIIMKKEKGVTFKELLAKPGADVKKLQELVRPLIIDSLADAAAKYKCVHL